MKKLNVVEFISALLTFGAYFYLMQPTVDDLKLESFLIFLALWFGLNIVFNKLDAHFSKV